MKKFLIYIFLLTSSIDLANKPRRVGLTFRVWECQNIPAVYDEWGTLVQIGYAHWTGRIVDDVKTVNFPGESCEGSAANIINTYGGITYQGINDAAASLHTMYTASNPVTGETVYYTDDGLTQAEITQILTDGGYTVHSEWFASPEAGLFPCPAPVKDLPVVTPLAEDLPVIDPIDYFCFTPQISLGIFDSKNQDNLGFYPNPANSQITLVLPLSKILKINILNISGKEILSIDKPQNQNLDISQIKSGIYFIEVIQNEGILRKKLIID